MAGIIGAIHVAKKNLGMDDETYRAFLRGITGKESCAKMNAKELKKVMTALRNAGFKEQDNKPPKAPKDPKDPKAPKAFKAPKASKAPKDPQARKIRALWLGMAKAGQVHNSSEEALNAYVRRICGQSLADATVKQCQAVIETLKKWIERLEDEDARKAMLEILRGDAAEPQVVAGRVVAGVHHARQ